MHILLNHMLNKLCFPCINSNSSLTGPFLKPMPLDKGADSRIRQWALWYSLRHWACRTDVKARRDAWTRCRQLDGWRSAVGLFCIVVGLAYMLSQAYCLTADTNLTSLMHLSVHHPSPSRFTLVGINVSWLRMLPTGIIMTIMLGLIPCCFCII